jgi:hypothetical protein
MSNKEPIYFNDEWNKKDDKPDIGNYDEIKIYLKDLHEWEKRNERRK